MGLAISRAWGGRVWKRKAFLGAAISKQALPLRADIEMRGFPELCGLEGQAETSWELIWWEFLWHILSPGCHVYVERERWGAEAAKMGFRHICVSDIRVKVCLLWDRGVSWKKEVKLVVSRMFHGLLLPPKSRPWGLHTTSGGACSQETPLWKGSVPCSHQWHKSYENWSWWMVLHSMAEGWEIDFERGKQISYIKAYIWNLEK